MAIVFSTIRCEQSSKQFILTVPKAAVVVSVPAECIFIQGELFCRDVVVL